MNIISYPYFFYSHYVEILDVLKGSILLLYQEPGNVKPSFIIPLGVSTELRRLSLPNSTPNKVGAGIVGNHVETRGFAVAGSKRGVDLFFVASSDFDYKMWLSALSLVLRKAPSNSQEQTTDPNVVSDNFSLVQNAAEDNSNGLPQDMNVTESSNEVILEKKGAESGGVVTSGEDEKDFIEANEDV